MRKIVLVLIGISLTAMIYAQETVKDVDGKEYKTVKIGSQTWMAENLKVSKTPDGNTIKQYCYDNDNENCEKYGNLYTWEVAKRICPTGWHLPDDYEWKVLTDNYGDRATAGLALREGGASGFNAEWGGYYNFDVNNFDLINEHAYFWTATEYDNRYAVIWNLNKKFDYIFRINRNKEEGFSVRCIKD